LQNKGVRTLEYNKTKITILYSKDKILEMPDVVATSPWCCVDCVIHHERDVREEQHHTHMWPEQAIIE